MIFDLLGQDGDTNVHLPFAERRRLLEGLDLNGPAWRTVHLFDNGETLFEAVERRGQSTRS
jgi:bifunctional non-homologous end joining protein LigD